MERGRAARARRCWGAAALGAALASGGCAYSMVVDGALRGEVMADLSARAAAVRGIAAPGEVPARVIVRDDLPALLHRVIAETWTPEEVADYQEGLVGVGVWPSERELVEDFVAVARDQLAGLYVPSDRRLYVVEDVQRPFSMRLLSRMLGRDLFLEFALSHEIVHWLQHRAYPWLLEEDGTWKDQDDYSLAVQAALEGDALRYGMEAWLEGSAALPTPDALDEAEADASDLDVPVLLRLSLILPYAAGYRLSYLEGRDLLDAPPVSTEQALHPERRREPFAVGDLAAARAALGDGCRVVAENTLGEAGISALFRELASEPSPAAWSGWDGDRYLVARCGEARELAWWTSWDDAGEAREFAVAYAEIAAGVEARGGLAGRPELWREGATVVVATPGFGPPGDWVPALRIGRVATAADLRRFFDAPYAHPGAPAP